MNHQLLDNPHPCTHIRSNSCSEEYTVNKFPKVEAITKKDVNNATFSLLQSWNQRKNEENPFGKALSYKSHSVIRPDQQSYVNFERNLHFLKKLKRQADINLDTLLQESQKLYYQLEDDKLKQDFSEMISLIHSLQNSNVLMLRNFLCKQILKKIEDLQTHVLPPKEDPRILGFLDNSHIVESIKVIPSIEDEKAKDLAKVLSSLLSKFSYIVASLGHFIHYYELTKVRQAIDKNYQSSPKSNFSPRAGIGRKSVSFRAFSPIRTPKTYSPERTRQSGISQTMRFSMDPVVEVNPVTERKLAFEERFDDEKNEAIFYHVKRYFRWKLEKWRDQDLEEVKIVCRICGQEIYAKTIKKHSYQCKLVAENEENLDHYNAKLAEIITGAKKEKRNVNVEVMMERKLLMSLRQQSIKSLRKNTDQASNDVSHSVEAPKITERSETEAHNDRKGSAKTVIIKKPRGKPIPMSIISVIFKPKPVVVSKVVLNSSPKPQENAWKLNKHLPASKSTRCFNFRPSASKSPDRKAPSSRGNTPSRESTPKPKNSTLLPSIFSPRGTSANKSREIEKPSHPGTAATGASRRSKFSYPKREKTPSSTSLEREFDARLSSPSHDSRVCSIEGTPVAGRRPPRSNFIIKKSIYQSPLDLKEDKKGYNSDSVLPPQELVREGSVERSQRRSAFRDGSLHHDIQRVQTLNALREKLQRLKELNNLTRSYETLINYASLLQNFDEFTRETRLAFEGAKKEVSELLSQTTNEPNVQKYVSKLWQVMIAKFETIRSIQTGKNEIKSIEQSNEVKFSNHLLESKQQSIELNFGNMSFSFEQDMSMSMLSTKQVSNTRKSIFAKNLSSQTRKVKKIRSKSVTKEIKAWQYETFMKNFRKAMRQLKKLYANKTLSPKQIKKKSTIYRNCIKTLILKETETPLTIRNSLKKKLAATPNILFKNKRKQSSSSSGSESSHSGSEDSKSSRSSSTSSKSGESSESDSESEAEFLDEKALNHHHQVSVAKREAAYFSDDPDNIQKYAKSSNRRISSIIRIDDFVFVKLVSKGAYGRVWLVRRKVTGDYYAMKIVNFCDRMNRNNIDSLKKEKEVFEIIQGDFIAKAIFTFVHQNYLCVVMEFLVGGDFSNILEKYGALDEHVAKFYIAEVIVALSSLHKLGIVHRDLKPSNIMLDKLGHIKLTDFGLSEIGMKNQAKMKKEQNLNGFWQKSLKMADDETQSRRKLSLAIPSMTHARLGKLLKASAKKEEKSKVQETNTSEKIRIVGTPDYIPPEVIKGECYNDPCIDWWSVGVLLFELLVGIPPFNDSDMNVVFDNIVHRRIPWKEIPIGYEEGSVTPEAKDLIDKLLELDRKKRLGSKGVKEIKDHPFFKGINWEDILKSPAPIIPDGGDITETRNFETGGNRFKANEMLSPFHDMDEMENFQGSKLDIKAENFQFTRLDILHEENQKVVSETKTQNHRQSSQRQLRGRKWSVFEHQP